MKIKIRPDDDASMHQMNDWLAELREDTAPAAPAVPAAPAAPAVRAAPATRAVPAAPAEPVARPEPVRPEPVRAEPVRAEPAVRVEPLVPANALGPGSLPRHARATARAVIGDQLRIPIMWCEMGSCISWHTDPAALGEGDLRVRAIGVGWRIDAFGRLACPRCQQTDPGFRASRPVVRWDRYTAMARTARIVAGRPAPAR